VRNHRKKLGALILILALVAIRFSLRTNPEPSYNGRRLSEWISIYATNNPSETTPDGEAAAIAIRCLGTNALPFLLEWIHIGTPAVPTIANLLANLHGMLLWYYDNMRRDNADQRSTT
jgi:hypothetical protein